MSIFAVLIVVCMALSILGISAARQYLQATTGSTPVTTHEHSSSSRPYRSNRGHRSSVSPDRFNNRPMTPRRAGAWSDTYAAHCRLAARLEALSEARKIAFAANHPKREL